MCSRWSVGFIAILIAVFGGIVLRPAETAQADRVVAARRSEKEPLKGNPEGECQKKGEEDAPLAAQAKSGRFQVLDASKADLRTREPFRGVLLIDTETGRLYGLLENDVVRPPLKWTLLAEGPK